ncbi:MAG: AAA family ATPase [Vicinamibacterales bacterium]
MPSAPVSPRCRCRTASHGGIAHSRWTGALSSARCASASTPARSSRRRDRIDGPYGEATIVASRLQTLAEPGQVLLSRSTWQLARGFISGRSLGQRFVKGRREPIEVFELASMDARTRFHARQNQGLTPFVGREGELRILERAYEAAATGSGQVVTVTGSPGIGKSRLLHHFVRYGIRDTTIVIEATAEPYDRDALYVPIANLVRSRLSIAPRDDADEIRARLAAHLARRDDVLAAMVLLDVALPGELKNLGRARSRAEAPSNRRCAEGAGVRRVEPRRLRAARRGSPVAGRRYARVD